MADRTLLRLDCAQRAEVRPALRDAGLPSDDLSDAAMVFQLDDAAGPVGWAALERHGGEALLRSVVILEGRRGRGAGTELIEKIVDVASGEGVDRLWLLTETAAPFFAGLGFARIDRAQASEAIRRSSEFSSVCPASADCMTLTLAKP